jgi:hypothetical protein
MQINKYRFKRIIMAKFCLIVSHQIYVCKQVIRAIASYIMHSQ